MLVARKELQSSSKWLSCSKTGSLPCLCLACVLLTVSWGQWNRSLGLIFILSWIISGNDKALLSLYGKQHETAGQVTIWPSVPFGKKYFCAGCNSSYMRVWCSPVTGHQHTGSQSQMGRFISIYTDKLLGICSTVLLNAKNDFGHQQSKIRCDISSGLMWVGRRM